MRVILRAREFQLKSWWKNETTVKCTRCTAGHLSLLLMLIRNMQEKCISYERRPEVPVTWGQWTGLHSTEAMKTGNWLNHTPSQSQHKGFDSISIYNSNRGLKEAGENMVAITLMLTTENILTLNSPLSHFQGVH